MQDHSILLNSTSLDVVWLRHQTNTTCCVEHTRIMEIRDLGRIMIPNFRPIYPLPLPERWLAACARIQQCWSARPNGCNLVVHTWEQKKCWTLLHRMFDGNQTSFNIIQYDAIWWPNEFNMLHSTMLKDVESRCCIRLVRALYQRFLIPSISKTRTVLFGCRKIISSNSKPLKLVRWITKNDPPLTALLLTKMITSSFS